MADSVLFWPGSKCSDFLKCVCSENKIFSVQFILYTGFHIIVGIHHLF